MCVKPKPFFFLNENYSPRPVRGYPTGGKGVRYMNRRKIIRALSELRKELPLNINTFRKKFEQITGCELGEFYATGDVFLTKEHVIRLRTIEAISHIYCSDKAYTAVFENVIAVYDESNEGYLISYNMKAVRTVSSCG
jgi:hypothetical protein